MFKFNGERIRKVLVFGAHPDDEIVGPGGTIARLSEEGAEVTVVTFTAGETAYGRRELKGKMAEIRTGEARKCDSILGIKERLILGLPCQGVVNDTATYQRCVGIVRDKRPDLVFSHYPLDKHRDHRAVAEIVDEVRWKASEKVLADLGDPWYCSYLFYYETLELFTQPSIVVDISKQFERKVRAMESQSSQVEMAKGVLGLIEGLARVRGFMAGTEYAEAFLLSNLLPGRI
jgi:LmbE family N-acetylglucosaminyl deacetylase